MIFRQLFDATSSTYTYLIASRKGGEALIIDPVLERVDRYIKLLDELQLRLIKAIDTHVHADHLTGLGELRDRTRCITVMGEQSGVDVVSMRVADSEKIEIEGIGLDTIYTPGHTSDSYSFLMGDRVFTGDTLLIRGTGRTDDAAKAHLALGVAQLLSHHHDRATYHFDRAIVLNPNDDPPPISRPSAPGRASGRKHRTRSGNCSRSVCSQS